MSSPVISNMVPTPGQMASTLLAARNTVLEFDVTDADDDMLLVLVSCRSKDSSGVPTGPTYVVFKASDFIYPFDSETSSVAVIANGFHFEILPRGGWLQDLDLWVYALDDNGNMEGTLP